MVEDNSVIADESGAIIKATSVKLEIENIYLVSFYPREEPETLGYLDTPIIPELPIDSLDRPTSLDVALP